MDHLAEKELNKVTGGSVFTPEQRAEIEGLTKKSAPTVMSRALQAGVGTALGFGANIGGNMAGESLHKKTQKNSNN